MTGANDELASEKVVRGTFARVDAWHSSPRFSAVPGSELFKNDQDWLPMPFTDSVKLELDLAAEQLHQIKVMVEANELSLTSQRILVRTALISGSIALWMISPDAPSDRASRHRLLVEQTLFRHHQAISEQIGLEERAGSVQPNLARMLEHTTTRLDEVKALRAADGQTTWWNDTDIIRAAALYAFRKEPDAQALANEAVLEFRVTSGAAHGLPWALFNSAGMRAATSTDQHGRAVMTAQPMWSDLANGYMAAYWVSCSAWKLLARRGR
jgi:hypothetical protein